MQRHLGGVIRGAADPEKTALSVAYMTDASID
jgi:hypothetical protein